MIKLLVIGNLGKDAVTNVVNGRNVINFNVAHTEKYKDAQGNQVEKTTWVECSYWTDRTAVVPYLKKGTQVYVEGNPDVRTYTTADGRNGASLRVMVQSVQLLGSRPEGGGGAGNYGGSNGQPAMAESSNMVKSGTPSATEITEPIDDLPF